MKVVINTCYGGFGLSEEAFERYLEIKGIEYEKKMDKYRNEYFHKGHVGNWAYHLYDKTIERNDPALVQVVEEFGDRVNDHYSELKVVEIPDDVDWVVEEYDGSEYVREVSRKWF